MKLWLTATQIPYRQGNIEVVARIHSGCVNIETWQVSPKRPVRADRKYEDGDVNGVVELELTPQEARTLASGLVAAADEAEISTG